MKIHFCTFSQYLRLWITTNHEEKTCIQDTIYVENASKKRNLSDDFRLQGLLRCNHLRFSISIFIFGFSFCTRGRGWIWCQNLAQFNSFSSLHSWNSKHFQIKMYLTRVVNKNRKKLYLVANFSLNNLNLRNISHLMRVLNFLSSVYNNK